jgi:hypothetical protein
VVIVQHIADSVKAYIEAFSTRGSVLPQSCPHPGCKAVDSLIRWGTYKRWAYEADIDYRIVIQRVRCKICGHTHSLLPDFVHPYRRYVIYLLQYVVLLYLFKGLGWTRLLANLEERKKADKPGPARSTIREWVSAFAYGAGRLLLDLLTRALLALDPLAELPDITPPDHLRRVPDPARQRRLHHARCFWLLAEQLYAFVKGQKPDLTFSSGHLFAFVLHWLAEQAVPPRLLWSPRLTTTPTTPF